MAETSTDENTISRVIDAESVAKVLPRIADLVLEERAPIIEEIQGIVQLELGKERPQEELLNAVTEHPEVQDRQDAVWAYLMGLGERWWEFDGLVHATGSLSVRHAAAA